MLTAAQLIKTTAIIAGFEVFRVYQNRFKTILNGGSSVFAMRYYSMFEGA